MKISIVIPTYNRAYILREALESVLAQSYTDFEVLVVDDGSTDDTARVVGSIQDKRIRYIQKERNQGCSAAYNTGIRAAQGEWIAFLDSDDLWKPEYLERQMDFLSRQAGLDVVFTDTEIIGGQEPISSLCHWHMLHLQALLAKHPKAEEYVLSGREMYICLLEEVPIKPSAAIFRRVLFDRAGMFDEAWPSGTDWDLFLRLSRISRFGYIDAVLATQRRTADATHQLHREKDKVFLLGVFLKEKAALNGDTEAIVSINRGIMGLYNSLAWIYLLSNRNMQALSTYWQGFKETRHPKLLKKLGSAAMRIAVAGTTSLVRGTRWAQH